MSEKIEIMGISVEKCYAEDVMESIEANHEIFLYTDVCVRGAYPSYANRYHEPLAGSSAG